MEYHINLHIKIRCKNVTIVQIDKYKNDIHVQ